MKPFLSLLKNGLQFSRLLLGHSMGSIGTILITLVLIAAIFSPYLGTVDPQASGMFCVDLKEAQEGTPCITEINIGRFFTITPVFNAVGRHHMADLFLRLAFGETITIDPDERFTDIGEQETFLVRELDNEPSVFTGEQVDQNYISVL